MYFSVELDPPPRADDCRPEAGDPLLMDKDHDLGGSYLVFLLVKVS